MHDPMFFRHIITLPQGLRVFHQPRNLDWFAAKWLIGVGERHNPCGKNELTHLLEHLVGVGTHGLPRMTFPQLQKWAAAQQFDVDYGETAVDYTAFGGKAPSEKMSDFLEFLVNFVCRPRLDAGFEHELELVRNERRERTTLRQRRTQRVRHRAVFGRHPLAKALGWAEDKMLDRLTLSDVQEHYHRYYGAPNMNLILVGGLDFQAARQLLERKVPAPVDGFLAPDRPLPIEFGPPRLREYRSKKRGKEPEAVRICYYWYLPPVHTGALRLVRNTLGFLADARVRDRLRMAYDVYADLTIFQDHLFFTLETEVAPQAVDQTRLAIEKTCREVQTMVEMLPEERAEFFTALRFMEINVDSALERAALGLSLYGRPRLIHELWDEVSAVTADEFRHVITEHIVPEKAYIEMVEK